MCETRIDLHFADALGRDHVLHAAIVKDGRWHLLASIEGRTFTKHCSRWQAVERTVRWLRYHAHEQQIEPRAAQQPSRLIAAALVLFMVASGAAAFAQSLNPAITAFENATQDYALMHRRLERLVGPIELSTSIDDINRKIQQLAAAIRAERPTAREGDLFTPPLARLLRGRIYEALTEHRYSVDDARVLSRVDGVDYTRVKLQVNDTFPWLLGAAMLPCLIDVLPPLPPELQYRMVDDLLVLVDVHASLIVDILPYALADLTVQNMRPQGWLR